MNVGDKVIAVPIDGDPKNVVVLPAEHVLAVNDRALMIPTDENKNSMVSVGYSLTDVGDKGILIPIAGDIGNVVFYSGRFCQYVNTIYEIFWSYPETESGEYIYKKISLPNWFPANTTLSLRVQFHIPAPANVYTFINNDLAYRYTVIPGSESGATVTDIFELTCSGGDAIGVYVTGPSTFYNMFIFGEPIQDGCPEPINSSGFW
ncbi:MAG: hypothetical protein KAJ03_09835 [Gammaproteobacteria bacterium]|nr:hypothetical protein [Gammaproteobacteria bacterium]